MKIQLLYWPGCPSHEEGLARLKKILGEEGITPEIEVIQVNSEDEARKLKFAGSPTFLINGKDIDAGGTADKPATLTCRVYRWNDGRYSPLPSEEMLREAVRSALR